MPAPLLAEHGVMRSAHSPLFPTQALAAAVAAALGGADPADPAAAAAGPDPAAATALLQTLAGWAATPHGAACCRRLAAQPRVMPL